MRRLVTAWLALLLLGCTPEPPTAEITQTHDRGEIRVGTLISPTSYYVQHDRESGFEYRLAAEFAEYLQVEVAMVPRYNVQDLLTLLERGEIDFIAAGLDRTPQRDEKFRFGPAYFTVDQRLIYRQASRERPRDFTEIDGEIMVVAGSSHHEYLQQIAPQYPQLKWRATTEHDAQELLEMVMLGELDFTIADSNILDVKRRYYPDLVVAFTLREEVPIAWAFGRSGDDSLYAAAIDYFGSLRDNGRLAHIIDQHFGHVAQFNYVDTQLFIDAVQTTLPNYIELFREHAGSLDWRLLAAVSYQESLWNPRAISPTGVRGMMMLTLPTAKQMGVQSRLSAAQSVRGGARYLERMLSRVPARIPHPDRLWFALAAYNIGFGHVEDARRLTDQQGADPDRWLDVKKRLPLLRQKKFYRQTRFGFARGDEPVTYVGNIRRYYDTLVWLDERGRIPSLPLNLELPVGSGDGVEP